MQNEIDKKTLAHLPTIHAFLSFASTFADEYQMRVNELHEAYDAEEKDGALLSFQTRMNLKNNVQDFRALQETFKQACFDLDLFVNGMIPHIRDCGHILDKLMNDPRSDRNALSIIFRFLSNKALGFLSQSNRTWNSEIRKSHHWNDRFFRISANYVYLHQVPLLPPFIKSVDITRQALNINGLTELIFTEEQWANIKHLKIRAHDLVQFAKRCKKAIKKNQKQQEQEQEQEKEREKEEKTNNYVLYLVPNLVTLHIHAEKYFTDWPALKELCLKPFAFEMEDQSLIYIKNLAAFESLQRLELRAIFVEKVHLTEFQHLALLKPTLKHLILTISVEPYLRHAGKRVGPNFSCEDVCDTLQAIFALEHLETLNVSSSFEFETKLAHSAKQFLVNLQSLKELRVFSLFNIVSQPWSLSDSHLNSNSNSNSSLRLHPNLTLKDHRKFKPLPPSLLPIHLNTVQLSVCKFSASFGRNNPFLTLPSQIDDLKYFAQP